MHKAILIERLKKLRETAGLTQVQIARQLGIERDAYAKYETRSVIPPEIAARASQIFNVPLNFLVSSDSLSEKLAIKEHNGLHALVGTVPVLVVGAVQAGVFREAFEWAPEEQKKLAMPVDVPYSDKPLQGLKVIGPSMNKWYPEGSYVVILPTIYLSSGWVPSTGQHVIVQRTNEWGEVEATIKEVAYEGDDLVLWPRSEDPLFQKPWRMTPPAVDPDNQADPIRITGLVVWSMRAAPGV